MTLVERTVYSRSGRHKAEIRERDGGIYQVCILKWTHEIVPGYGEVCPPFWADTKSGVSFTDTVENAVKIAEERLRNVE